MKMAHNPHEKPAQPALDELFSRYLQRQTQASAAGLGHAESLDEVLPYEAVQVQPIDPRQAWEDGVFVFGGFSPTFCRESIQPPVDWPALVAQWDRLSACPTVSLAFAACNFPGLIRSLHPFWSTTDLTQLCPPQNSRANPQASLVDWALDIARNGNDPQRLVAVGTLRLAQQFSAAEELLVGQAVSLSHGVGAEWRNAWANEEAALAWHRGQTKEAFRMWQEMPDSVPVHFNRGMSALFLGKVVAARTSLSRAVQAISEASAWHHLGRFYLALTDLATESR